MKRSHTPRLILAVTAALVAATATAASFVPAAGDLLQLGWQLLVSHGSAEFSPLLLASFAPSVVTRAVREQFEVKNEGEEGAPSIVEIKRLLEEQGKAWKAFRDANDAMLKAKAEGKAVSDLEAKLDAVSRDMDKLAEVKQQVDELLLKLARPGAAGSSKAAEDLQAETKSFNLALRADMQSKGKPHQGDLSVDAYAQYKSAFMALARHGDMERLTADERKSLSAGSDPDGGYLMPAAAQSRTVMRVYEQSVMRRLATVQTLSGDAIEGIIDNGEAGAGWVSEMGSRPETATPNLGKYRIETHELYAEPRVTQKLLDDAAVDVEAWLAGKVADKFARTEGLAFWRGTGVGQPRGLATYDTVTTDDDSRAWGVFQHIATGTNGTLGTGKADPLMDLIGAMRDVYLQGASWCMRREVRTLVRKLKEATTDRYLWEPSLQAGQPDRLMGYAVNVDQYMPALATGSLSLAFGDFAEAYTIVDRLGIRVLRDPYTAKPFVKFYTTKRTGGAAVNFEAVKFIRFA